MALRGNLKDFSLPDVFQLVTFSRKTGVLRIEREDGATGSVWFRDGDVFFAQSNWHTEPLGERLVKAQRITPQALKRALDVRGAEPESGRRLGQILIDEGYITEKVLEAFVSEQIQDTIFDLMRWDEGDFDFEAMPEVVDEDIGLSVSMENVVMEGARRLEEWTRIKKKIPSMDVVFKMATAPGEGTFEISLKPMEWQLLLLVDGTRSVAELATETSRTDFEVARIVYGLFSAGLLEFATDDEIAHNRAERTQREAKRTELETARKAAEQKQQQEAIEREEKLAREAEERRAAEQDAAEKAAAERAEIERAAAEQASAEMVVSEPAEEEPQLLSPQAAEVPEFLGGAQASPSADDQAVLEQFMGAVLQQPLAQPAAPEPEPVEAAQAAPEPYVPGEEPPFVSMAHDDDSDEPIVAVPSVEELLGIAPLEVASTDEETPSDDVSEPIQAAEPEPARADEPPQPEPERIEDAEPEPSQPEPEEFARDLLALGLGELPSDLLSPMSAETTDIETVEDQGEESPVSGDLLGEPGHGPDVVAEPMSEIDGWALTTVEPEPESISEEPEPSDEDIEDLSASFELPMEMPQAVEPEHEPDEAPDFSALLDSLDVDAEPAPAPVEIEPVEPEAGFDTDLLLDEEPAPTGGVISTDAFLEDISIEDIGFSGSLNDELSALTGADRRGTSRPQASVNAIPDPGASALHRDTRVDKDTLLKIIDGIKNL